MQVCLSISCDRIDRRFLLPQRLLLSLPRKSVCVNGWSVQADQGEIRVGSVGGRSLSLSPTVALPVVCVSVSVNAIE